MRKSEPPEFPVFDQDDQEKLRNELILSFFGPSLLIIAVLALLFRFVVGDALAAAHPALAEQIQWTGRKFKSSARFTLLGIAGSILMIVYFWVYLKHLRKPLRERGWV